MIAALATTVRRRRTAKGWRIVLYLFCGAVLFLLITPSFIVLPMSLNTSCTPRTGAASS